MPALIDIKIFTIKLLPETYGKQKKIKPLGDLI